MPAGTAGRVLHSLPKFNKSRSDFCRVSRKDAPFLKNALTFSGISRILNLYGYARILRGADPEIRTEREVFI